MTEQITDRQKKTISGSFAAALFVRPPRIYPCAPAEREQRAIQSREGKLMAAIISADSRDDDVSVLNATAESPRRDYSRNVSPISQSRQGRAGGKARKKPVRRARRCLYPTKSVRAFPCSCRPNRHIRVVEYDPHNERSTGPVLVPAVPSFRSSGNLIYGRRARGNSFTNGYPRAKLRRSALGEKETARKAEGKEARGRDRGRIKRERPRHHQRDYDSRAGDTPSVCLAGLLSTDLFRPVSPISHSPRQGRPGRLLFSVVTTGVDRASTVYRLLSFRIFRPRLFSKRMALLSLQTGSLIWVRGWSDTPCVGGKETEEGERGRERSG